MWRSHRARIISGAAGSKSWARLRGAKRPVSHASRIGVANFDALHDLMSTWSRTQTNMIWHSAAQTAHVPCFALGTPAEQLQSNAACRTRFLSRCDRAGKISHARFRGCRSASSCFQRALTPRAPLQRHRIRTARTIATGCRLPAIRVLDFSWVIAGPTTTRYLAALGAEVIKVEAPGRGDPGRTSELHTVLGQGKRAITLDLKTESGRELARSLVRESDVVIENFATGVMDRLGLGESVLARHQTGSHLPLGVRPWSHRTRVNSSGLRHVAAMLFRFRRAQWPPGSPTASRHGMARSDVRAEARLHRCGVFVATRLRRQRRAHRLFHDRGDVVDDGSTVARRSIGRRAASTRKPLRTRVRHTASIRPAVTMHGSPLRCAAMLNGASCAPSCPNWANSQRLISAHASRNAQTSMHAWPTGAQAPIWRPCTIQLVNAGVPSSPVHSPNELFENAHLQARGFWNAVADGHLPGLPWQLPGDTVHSTPAPELGADNAWVTREVLGLSEAEHRKVQAQGAFGERRHVIRFNTRLP